MATANNNIPPASELLRHNECAVLVASCDAYSDLWKPFFNLMRKFWPDCPFPLYLGTGRAQCIEAGVTTLASDGGRDWSKCMQDYLNQIPQNYVLLMLDDFFLRMPVQTKQVLHCLEFAMRHGACQTRLMARPGPTKPVPGESLVGLSEVSSPYRLSTQAAIWNRSELSSLLVPGESIWDFEHQGNARAKQQPGGFYSVWSTVLPYQGCFAHHVVEKGLWLPTEKWIYERQDIGCDFSRRGTLPCGQALFYYAAQTLESVLTPIGWRRKSAIKRRLRRLLSPMLAQQLKRLGRPTK